MRTMPTGDHPAEREEKTNTRANSNEDLAHHVLPSSIGSEQTALEKA